MNLSAENFKKGFLVDDEMMGGITQNPENPAQYVGFVLSHLTGEYVAYQPFESLEAALEAMNRIPRQWAFEKVGGCGNGNCGTGACKGGGCGKKTQTENKETAETGCESGSCAI